ncbi:hypothetical protein GGX14DRAFT_390355 [Mycena pura]|uniref:Uncharacterized protein n=1 Tax=Mycena pura TaxID=153505 RepID=A0AAD6VW11_9AGAR|nr:hypothetical protein GGX14DRAFT_390355 [Mycena pura]
MVPSIIPSPGPFPTTAEIQHPLKIGIGTGNPYPRGYTGFTRTGTGTGNVGYTRETRGCHASGKGGQSFAFVTYTRTLPASKPVPVPVGTGTQPPRVRVRVVVGILTGLPVPMPTSRTTLAAAPKISKNIAQVSPKMSKVPFSDHPS